MLMGERTKKNILIIAGVIGTMVGIVIAIPFFLNETYWLGIVGVLILIAGLITLAVGFGD